MTERCELCNRSVDDSMRGRIAHLRTEHPSYAQGVLLRLAAPVVFIAGVFVMSLARAPQPAYLVALGVAWALLFFGKLRSRKERVSSGTTATLGFVRTIREGGFAFVLVVPIIAGLILLLGR